MNGRCVPKHVTDTIRNAIILRIKSSKRAMKYLAAHFSSGKWIQKRTRHSITRSTLNQMK